MAKNPLQKTAQPLKGLPRQLDFFIIPALVFILAASPVLFGSVGPFHLAVIEISVLFLFFAWLASWLQKGLFQFVVMPGAFALLFFIAYLLAQYFFTSRLLYGIFAPGEAYCQQIKDAILRVIMYAVLFYAVLNNFTSRRKQEILIYALVSVGFCLALLGMLQKLSGADSIFWISALPEETGKQTAFFSCFPNRDHFANYMNMLAFLTLGFIFSLLPRLREAVKGFDRGSISKGLHLAFRYKIWLYIFVFIIMASSVFYSLCRAGIASFFISLLLFSGLVIAKNLTRRGHLILLVLIFLMGVMLLWIGAPEQINKRFTGGFGKEGRLTHMIIGNRKIMADTTIEMIKTYPVFGIGAGAFQLVYNRNFKPGQLKKFDVDHAHNDILEFVSETGFFGAASFLLTAGFYLALLVRLLKKRKDPFSVGISIGCITAMLSMLIHAFFDFTFHITSNAILFFVIAALGICAAGSRVGPDGETTLLPKGRAITIKNIYIKTLLFIALAALFIFGALFVIRPYMAYRVIYKTDPHLVELNNARRILPLSDRCHFALSEFFFTHAAGKKRNAYRRLAVKEIKEAMRLNPWREYYPTYLEFIEESFAKTDDRR